MRIPKFVEDLEFKDKKGLAYLVKIYINFKCILYFSYNAISLQMENGSRMKTP